MNNPLSTSGYSPDHNDRRRFLGHMALLSGAALLAPAAAWSAGNNAGTTAAEIVNRFIAEVPNAPFEKTVDTFKTGKPETPVTGIITTMFPTIAVIRRAIQEKVNFIICHEPIFYNHQDETGWLENDDVFRYKKQLLDEHGIIVWRNHDYIHRHSPDGVLTGMINQLGWKERFRGKENNLVFDPAITLEQLIRELKNKLRISTLRFVGDLSQVCKSALLLPGAYGGRLQVGLTSQRKPDVLICGEVSEWETAEYVRDANLKGQKLGLVLLGHVASEEPGSLYMIDWLKTNYPGIRAIHVPAENPLTFV